MALQFNGTTQHLDLSSGELNGQAITITAWIYPTEVANAQHVICSTDSIGAGYRAPYAIAIMQGKLTAQITYQNMGLLGSTNYNTVVITSPNPMAVNKWSHVAFTFSQGHLILYEQGHQVAATNTNQTPVAGVDACVGADRNAQNTWQYHFAGQMEDFRIYTRAISGNEILTMATLNGKDNNLTNEVLDLPMNSEAKNISIGAGGKVKNYSNGTTTATAIASPTYWESRIWSLRRK